MKHLTASPFQQRGVSLIEVLVTALIMGVGLIGMASLQAKSSQFNQGAYLRSQANLLAYDISERMRTNRSEATTGQNADANSGKVFIANPYKTDYTTTEDSTTTIAKSDLAAWKQNLITYLGPLAQGKVECTPADKSCTISIRWAEAGENPTDKDSDNKPDPTNEFVYITSF
jgi:type IV pilus assembly protein PilV